MSFNDEYLKLRKKRLEGEEQRANSFGLLYQNKTLVDPSADDDIAPVKEPETETYGVFRKKTKQKSTDEEDDRKWFQKGAFEDGYQFGDLFKTLSSSGQDLEENIMAGILGMGEKAVDTGAYIVGGVGGLFSEDFKESAKEFAAKDLYDEKEVAKKIVGARNISSLWTDTENDSVFGEKSDDLAQSGGQLLGTIALQSVGVPWFVTSGVTSFGSEVENAFNQGATYEQAGLSAAITAGAEILTEKLFGGSGLGEKGLINLEPLTKGISNKVAKLCLDYGLDIAAEGSEEVFSQIMSNLGSALYREENLGEILASEEAFEGYFESFIGGAALGGVANFGKAVNSKKTGTDYRTGLTSNEQAVFDKEYNERIAEAEKQGKVSAKKKAEIYDEVMDDLNKGRISTDTIESVLGGETYKQYQDSIAKEKAVEEQEKAINDEIKKLVGTPESQFTIEQRERLTELREQLKNLDKTSNKEQLKAQLSEEVEGIAQTSDILSQSYKEKARSKQLYQDDPSVEYKSEAAKKTAQNAVESGVLNNNSYAHDLVNMMTRIAEDTGNVVGFTNNKKMVAEGRANEGDIPEGYTTDDGFVINVNAPRYLNVLTGHEVTHKLEKIGSYSNLAEVIEKYARDKGEWDSRYTKRYDRYKKAYGLDENNAESKKAYEDKIKKEVVADLVGDYLFTDKAFVENLSVTNRNVFQKVWDEIKYLWKVATAGSKEKRQLEAVKRTFEQVYRESGKQAQAETDAKYALTGWDADGIEVYETSEETKNLTNKGKNKRIIDLMQNEFKGRTAKFTTDSQTYYAHLDKVGLQKGLYGDKKSSNAGRRAKANIGADGNYIELVENATYYGNSAEQGKATDSHKKVTDWDYFVKEIASDGIYYDVLVNVRKTSDGEYVYDVNLWENESKKDVAPLVAKTVGERQALKSEETTSFKDSIPQNSKKSSGSAKFSLSKSVEETKDLVAVHNLKAGELLKSLELGGLPMPSIAVIKADAGHDQYGEISLIMPKETIDPQANRDNKVYGGDAWTPTYPRMEYKANESVAKRVRDKYYALERKYGHNKARPLYGYVYELENVLNRSGGETALKEELYDDTRMMQVYLLDSGKGEVPMVTKEIRTELTDHEVNMYEFLNNELGADVVDAVTAKDGESIFQHRKQYWEEHGEAIKEAYGAFLSKEFDFSKEDIQNVLANMKTADFLKVVRDAKKYQTNGRVTTKTEDDYQATQEAIRKAAGEGYKAWVDELFAGSEEKSGIRNNVDAFTRSGNRRSWDALHWENTLENVVKAMKQQDSTGSEAVFGVHKFFAASSKDYKSIAEIKADSDRLHKISDGDYKSAKDSFENRLVDVAKRIMDKAESNQFIALDNAMECIVDAIRHSRTKVGILKELKQYRQLNVTEADVNDIVSLVNDISNMPTGYFEAKPQRAVGFDEVGVFVIPRNADVKLKQELLNRGYSIAEYDPDVEGDRQKVVNSLEEYKFSLSDVNEQSKHYGNFHISGKDVAYVPQEIAPTQETVSKMEQVEDYAPITEEEANALQSENIASLTDEDAPPEVEAPYYAERGAIALDGTAEKQIVDDVNAVLYLDAEDTARMKETIQKYAQNPDITEGELYEHIRRNFHFVEEFEATDSGDALQLAKKHMRGTKIYVPEDLKGDFNGRRKDGFNQFRKEHMGHFYLTTNEATSALGIDQVYAELNELFPELFPGDIMNPADQLQKMGEVANTTPQKIMHEGEYDDDTIQEVCNIIRNGVDQYSQSETARLGEEARNSIFASDDFAPVAEVAEEISKAPAKEAYEAIKPKREPSNEPRLKRVKADDASADGKQRKWVGTSTESEAVDGKVLPEDLDQEAIHYQPISNEKTLSQANARLNSMGYENAVTYFNGQFTNKKTTVEDIVLGERLIQEAIKRGDTKTAGELIQDVSILGTELGQKVQALSIIKRLTPEGQLRMLRRTVERGKTKGDRAFEGVEITQEMIDHILKTYGKDGTYDQAKLNEAVEDVKKKIADQMNVTKLEKVNAWRYLSMLGNPKTHIRNLVSNVAMRGTLAVKNAVARTIEDIAPVKNRTKTWKASSDAVKAFAQKTAIEMKETLSDGGKYNEEASIKAKRQVFKNKVLNGVYNLNSDLLSKEDWWFSKPAFTNALKEYLTANGIETEQDIQNNPKVIAKAKQYATEQSQIATFRQYSWLANKINEIEHKNAATNIAVGAVLPFKKTPINIAKTALNYSPLGFAKTLTYDASQVKNGKMQASELVDHLAQNLTGTALTLVGYMLASAGFINGAGEDDKEAKYDYQLGEQAYSINIGDATFSMSWLSPIAMPLFVGANAYEQLVEGKEWNGDVVTETLAQTLDPLSEMSFLSSLDDVLSSYDSGVQKFAGIAQSAGQSYISQFVPTISSQLAATLDDTKRTTKVAGDSDFKFFDETINNLKYKIPFLRETLEPSTDIWGNEVKQSEYIVERAFESFIAPYAKRQDISTGVDEEIKELYRQTGDDGLIPSIPYNYVNYDGEKYKMSAEEFTEYKKAYGQTAYDLMERLFDTETYQYATYEERADMVNEVYDYARDEAKRELLAKRGVEYTNAKADGEEYYKEGSIAGAIEADMEVDEYDFANKYPEKYAVAKSIGGYEKYKTYSSELYDIKADKDEYGKSITGSRKEKVIEYVNNLDIDYGMRLILFKNEYNADDTYNYEIIDYLNSREDISYEDMETILKELGFNVDSKGNITWD